MEKNLFVIHGYNGDTAETFGPYVESETNKLGIKSYFPKFPIKQEATYKSWSEEMHKYLERGLINENSIIVAHSLGTHFIPRYLAENNIRIYLYISMAGFLKDHSGREDLEKVVNNFVPNDEQIKKSTELMDNRFSIYSDNDHLNTKEELERYAERFKANKVFIPNVGHMGRKSGVKEIPEIMQIIEKHIK